MEPEKRYHAKSGFLKTKDFQEKNIPTLREMGILNDLLLNREAMPVVYVLTYSHEIIQILFDKHIYIKAFDFNNPWAAGGKYLLVNPKFIEDDKTLNRQMLLRYFPVHVLTTPDTGWDLYTVITDVNRKR